MHVTIITEDAVRELAGFNGEGVPVTTCYLDVDGRRYEGNGIKALYDAAEYPLARGKVAA